MVNGKGRVDGGDSWFCKFVSGRVAFMPWNPDEGSWSFPAVQSLTTRLAVMCGSLDSFE